MDRRSERWSDRLPLPIRSVNLAKLPIPLNHLRDWVFDSFLSPSSASEGENGLVKKMRRGIINSDPRDLPPLRYPSCSLVALVQSSATVAATFDVIASSLLGCRGADLE